MTVRGNPAALGLGPGYLYVGPLGTTEPVDLVATWASVSAAWALLGYTDAGSTFNHQLNTTPVPVAEEYDPITNAPDSRAMDLGFALAEVTATHLKTALNGGTITSGSGCVYFEPPDPGTEVRVMLAFQSEDGTERWIFRQCLNNGQISIPRQKGATKAIIPCTFMLEKPASGLRPWRAIMASPARQ
jgi:hypothetical protein